MMTRIKSYLRHNPAGIIGFSILAAALFIASAGHLFAPFDPYEIAPAESLLAPGGSHVLGTDNLGRDVLSRLLVGLPYSLYTAFGSVTLALAMGLVLGLASGFLGGQADNIIMRVCDIIFAFPPILLAIAIMSVMGPGLENIILAIAIVYTPRFARMSRGQVLSVKEKEYIEAARSLGTGLVRILYCHVLPNISGPLFVQTTLSLSTATLNEAALSFLGLGAQPPNPAWGLMVSESRDFIYLAPWLAVFPSLAIIVLLIGYNFAGDAVRDILDPRIREVR